MHKVNVNIPNKVA